MDGSSLLSFGDLTSTPTEEKGGFCKVHNWLEKDSTRWVLLFVLVIPMYIWLMIKAYMGKMSNKNKEDKQFAYLFGRGGGYNEKRGDPNSPSLFKWSASEIIFMLVILVLTILQFWWIVIGFDFGTHHFGVHRECESIWVRLSKFFIVWTHTTLVLFLLLPINKFHKRLNYNVRAAAISIVNDPLKELVLAFAFIVLLPLPHAQEATASDKFTWLAAKLGIFYTVQNVFLGRPNYKLKNSDDDSGVSISKKAAYVYAGLIVVMIIYWALNKYVFPKMKEHCKPPKPVPCPAPKAPELPAFPGYKERYQEYTPSVSGSNLTE